jgi:uncharacterized membrane protein
MSSESDTNGHDEIYDNIVWIKDILQRRETATDRLASSVDRLTASIEQHHSSMKDIIEYVNESHEKTVTSIIESYKSSLNHAEKAIPERLVIIIMAIICLAFVSSETIKAILHSPMVSKWLGS